MVSKVLSAFSFIAGRLVEGPFVAFAVVVKTVASARISKEFGQGGAYSSGSLRYAQFPC